MFKYYRSSYTNCQKDGQSTKVYWIKNLIHQLIILDKNIIDITIIKAFNK